MSDPARWVPYAILGKIPAVDARVNKSIRRRKIGFMRYLVRTRHAEKAFHPR
jgi:hypothetical protein